MLVAEVRVKKVKPPRSTGVCVNPATFLMKPRSKGASTMTIDDALREALETHRDFVERRERAVLLGVPFPEAETFWADAGTDFGRRLGEVLENPPCTQEEIQQFTPEQIAEFRETMKGADLSSVEWVPCEK